MYVYIIHVVYPVYYYRQIYNLAVHVQYTHVHIYVPVYVYSNTPTGTLYALQYVTEHVVRSVRSRVPSGSKFPIRSKDQSKGQGSSKSLTCAVV